MSCVQLLSRSTLATDRHLRRRVTTTAVSSGAMSASRLPCNHGSVQKKRASPLPSVIWMDALKNAIVVASSFSNRDVHDRAGSER
jgi:hypothetical protein